MEYLSTMETIVKNSGLYRDFLSRMPAPLNNIYFDTLLAALLLLYLLYLIIDGIRLLGRKKHLRRMKEEALQRSEQERTLREQETEMQKGRLAAFLQFLQMQGRGQSRNKADAYDSPANKRGIGTSRFRIGSTHSATDFERLMEEARRNEEG